MENNNTNMNQFWLLSVSSVPFLFLEGLLDLFHILEVVGLLLLLFSYFTISVLLSLDTFFIISCFLEDGFIILCLFLFLNHPSNTLIDLLPVISFVVATLSFFIATVFRENFPILFLFK